jgi:hypothetical protein
MTLAFVFLLCVSGFGLAATINQIAIVEAVNAKLPTAGQFGELGWWPSKILRLHREYRRLYPDGTLLKRGGILSLAMLSFLVVAATLFGFGLPGIIWIGGIGAFSLWLVYFRTQRPPR